MNNMWRKVADELPEEYREVITWSNNISDDPWDHIDVDWVERLELDNPESELVFCAEKGAVTHWMPKEDFAQLLFPKMD